MEPRAKWTRPLNRPFRLLHKRHRSPQSALNRSSSRSQFAERISVHWGLFSKGRSTDISKFLWPHLSGSYVRDFRRFMRAGLAKFTRAWLKEIIEKRIPKLHSCSEGSAPSISIPSRQDRGIDLNLFRVAKVACLKYEEGQRSLLASPFLFETFSQIYGESRVMNGILSLDSEKRKVKSRAWRFRVSKFLMPLWVSLSSCNEQQDRWTQASRCLKFHQASKGSTGRVPLTAKLCHYCASSWNILTLSDVGVWMNAQNYGKSFITFIWLLFIPAEWWTMQ